MPNFCSSASNRMVSRGARKTRNKLAQVTSPLMLASAKGLVMSKTKKIPVSTKNMAPTIYAVGVE